MKQKDALSTAEICEALGMGELKGRKWHVQGAVAIRGEGLYEGLDWCAPFVWYPLPTLLMYGQSSLRDNH